MAKMAVTLPITSCHSDNSIFVRILVKLTAKKSRVYATICTLKEMFFHNIQVVYNKRNVDRMKLFKSAKTAYRDHDY